MTHKFDPMKPKLYKVRSVFGIDKIEEKEQAAIDLLLDAYGCFAAIRDIDGLFKAEKASCNTVLFEISKLLDMVTSKPKHNSFRIKINGAAIGDRAIEALALFSERNKKIAREIIKAMLGH